MLLAECNAALVWRLILGCCCAQFKGIQSTGPGMSWAAEEEGVTVEDFLRFVRKQRYRFEATITDEDAQAMFAEADLLQDGVLDRTELANTALSYGIESAHLVQWCTLFNLFVDPHASALAVPIRVTKRHNLQSNSENYEEARYFKPNLTATHQYKKTNNPTSRPAKGLAVRRCDGRRDIVEYAHSDALNDTVMSGSEEREDGSATFSFAAQEAFDAALASAADASTESQGAIARGKQHATNYPPWPRPWISSAITELSWPAVPGSDTPLTLKDAQPPRPQKDFFLNFHLDSNQDMRTQYALSVQGDQGPYHPLRFTSFGRKLIRSPPATRAISSASFSTVSPVFGRSNRSEPARTVAGPQHTTSVRHQGRTGAWRRKTTSALGGSTDQCLCRQVSSRRCSRRRSRKRSTSARVRSTSGFRCQRLTLTWRTKLLFGVRH